jgi:hypothetical protein
LQIYHSGRFALFFHQCGNGRYNKTTSLMTKHPHIQLVDVSPEVILSSHY